MELRSQHLLRKWRPHVPWRSQAHLGLRPFGHDVQAPAVHNAHTRVRRALCTQDRTRHVIARIHVREVQMALAESLPGFTQKGPRIDNHYTNGLRSTFDSTQSPE